MRADFELVVNIPRCYQLAQKQRWLLYGADLRQYMQRERLLRSSSSFAARRHIHSCNLAVAASAPSFALKKNKRVTFLQGCAFFAPQRGNAGLV